MREHQHGAGCPRLTGRIDRRRSDQCVDRRLKIHACGVLVPDSSTDACLCLSGIPLFLETNVVANLGVTIAGEPTVTDILTDLVCGYTTSIRPTRRFV